MLSQVPRMARRTLVTAARRLPVQNNSLAETHPQPLLSILKRIRQDLIEVDLDNDRHVDYEELKLLLGKYPEAFTPRQIDRIGELFFVGRAGKPVRHSTFLRQVQYILGHDDNNHQEPLQLESISLKGCWVVPEKKGDQQFHNVQREFDEGLQCYIQQISRGEGERAKKGLC